MPSRVELRRLLDKVLPSDPELTQFCLDYFPKVQQRFSEGMDRLAKVNLLLGQVEGAAIFAALREMAPEAVLVSSADSPPVEEAVWIVPHLRNPDFTGRSDLLDRLFTSLAPDSSSAGLKAQAISGLGGVGKTQVAIEFAYRHRTKFNAVFWVSADNEETLRDGLATIAYRLRLVDPAQPPATAVAAAQAWLHKNKEWLLIFDSTDQPEVARPYWPQCSHGSCLLTTRAPNCRVLGLARVEQLREFSPEEALRFLRQRSERPDSGATETESVAELAHELGYLPLALEQAAGFIFQNCTRFADYLQEYRNQRLSLLEKGRHYFIHYPSSVATTWSLSFQIIEESHPASAEILSFCAFLYPTGIPEELLASGAHHIGRALADAISVGNRPLSLDFVLEPLLRYFLVRRDPESRLLHIHRMVQEALKHTMSSEAQAQWLHRVIQALNQIFPSGAFATWPQCQRLLAHVRTAQQTLDSRLRTRYVREEGVLFSRAGLYLYEQANYGEAERFLLSAHRVIKQTSSTGEPALSESFYNLGMLYHAQGRFEEAEKHHREALAMRQHIYGEHPTVAQSLHAVGALYHDAGKYAEAEPLCRQALSIREKALEATDPELANSLHTLAALLARQQRVAEAQPVYLRALEIENSAREPVYDHIPSSLVYAVHPLTISEQVVPLYMRALEIRQKAYGDNHPQVALSLNNLAQVFTVLNRTDLAENYCQRALDIWKAALGAQHPKVATCLINLADLYLTLGRKAQAEPLYQQALSIRRAVFGEQHPKVATALQHLGALWAALGSVEESRRSYADALAILLQSVGEGHPEVQSIRDSLDLIDGLS